LNNPFDLYSSKKYNKENRKCTKELKDTWKRFTIQVSKIQHEHHIVGASDTASREAYSEWVSKQALNGGLM